MGIHKYLFYMPDKGIKTYKIGDGNELKLVRRYGEDVYDDPDMEKFFSWFDKMASISSDDSIEFCFVSEKEIALPKFRYQENLSKIWNKEELIQICEQIIGQGSFELFSGERKLLVHQMGNIYGDIPIPKLYLKCIPDNIFKGEEERKEEKDGKSKEVGEESISILNRYYREQIKNLIR